MSPGSTETRADSGVVAVDAVRPLSGLEFITALADGRFPRPPIATLLDFRPVEVGAAAASCSRLRRANSIEPARRGARRLRRDAAGFLHGMRGPHRARSRPELHYARAQGELRPQGQRPDTGPVARGGAR